MHQFERGAQLDQVMRGTERGGMGIGDERQELVQVLLDEGANLAMRKTLGRRIHGKHQPRIALILVVRFGQHDELAWHELLAMVVAHRSGHQQQLSLLDLPLEKRAAGPGALEQAAVVLQHGAEHAQAPPGRQHARADHTAHARHILANGGPRQRHDGGGVEIAMGNVIQQIADRANAEPL